MKTKTIIKLLPAVALAMLGTACSSETIISVQESEQALLKTTAPKKESTSKTLSKDILWEQQGQILDLLSKKKIRPKPPCPTKECAKLWEAGVALMPTEVLELQLTNEKGDLLGGLSKEAVYQDEKNGFEIFPLWLEDELKGMVYITAKKYDEKGNYSYIEEKLEF
ncbi:hypothetical protein [Sediminicola luteus]|uniref:hypothetical protein n=1 Tax=Sediminicola luteus TaxID=319238 RepID=UPI001557E999|nr:hypothetical protein [Sediminicola luteus]